jgi:hypothetical protein
VTFRTRENYRTEYMQFKVADFETVYNVLLVRLALTKFIKIPHYAYMVLKMSGPHGVISDKGVLTFLMQLHKRMELLM